MTGILVFYRRREATAAIVKESAVTQSSQDGRMFGHSCGLNYVHVLSVFGYDYEMVLFWP